MADFKKDLSKPPFSPPSNPEDDLLLNPSADEFLKRLQSDVRRPQPSQEAVSAARQAMIRAAAESAGDASSDALDTTAAPLCATCGYRNRPASHFCGMCGLPLEVKPAADVEVAASTTDPEKLPGSHHVHHHYHHHYFASSPDFQQVAGRGSSPDAALRDPARFRGPGAPQSMSRAEAAVRKVTQDWALACNSRQLDDLVSTYSTDAIVMRSNHPAVRGGPAIREFFFSALESGLGEVELDVLRVDVIGEVAYEAGRCKMLVPTAMGKRREERGKYLMILSRQSNAEWRIVADCWSSDLSLSLADSDIPKAASPLQGAPKPPLPRKP